MLAFVNSRNDLLHLWERKVIGAFVNKPIAEECDIENVSKTQKQVLKTVDNFLIQRKD